MVDDGVVANVRDIDLGMLLGAGWPFHLGGIAPYLDRTGIAESVTGSRFLPRGVASIPPPAAASASHDDDASLEPVPSALPADAFIVTAGELTATGLTATLASVAIASDPDPDTPRRVVVTFAMPLPVAQLALFAGRSLPVPMSMFTATVHAFGAVLPVDLQSISVVTAASDSAVLRVTGSVDPTAARLPYVTTNLDLTVPVTVGT
jgi:hypothetical protein